MIPADLASRLQLAADSALRPITPLQEISDKLSDLAPGQRITAEIQALMPNGTYRAMINQRDVTLSLPFSAKAGDALELEVVESGGKLVLAVLSRPPGDNGKPPAESVPTTLSRTGQLISNLFGNSSETKTGPLATALNGNQPIASAPPANAQDILPLLKLAITQSGMFYESHQAEWVDGRFAKSALLQEPQGKLSSPTALAAVLQGELSAPGRLATALQAGGLTLPPALTNVLPGRLAVPAALAATAQGALDDAPGAHPSPTAPGLDAPAMPVQRPEMTARLAAYSTTENMLSSAQNHEAATLLPPLAGAPQEAAAAQRSDTPPTATPAGDTSAGQETASQKPETASRQAMHSMAAPAAETSTLARPLNDSPVPQNPANDSLAAKAAPAQLVTSEAMPIVQQQLEALATQNFVWQGQVWPGQQMRWEIEEDARRLAQEAENSPAWATRLQLTLPQLGEVEARIRLQGTQISLALISSSETTRELMRSAAGTLRNQLDEAGLALAALGIDQTGTEPTDA